MRVDAHVHLFPAVAGRLGAGLTRGTGYGSFATGDREEVLLPPFNEDTRFTPAMLIAHMDWAGVDRVVLMQGPTYGEWNQYALDAIGEYPDRLCGVAYLDPWEEGWRRSLEAIVSTRGFRGVKLECWGLFSLHPRASLGIPELNVLWKTLEKNGMVLTLDLGAIDSRSYETAHVKAVAERYPGLNIVIAHLGQPCSRIERDAEWKSRWIGQIELGLLPNVWFDTAALPHYFRSEEEYPYPSAERYLRLAIERIGVHKVMWGSDAPGMLSLLTYPQLVRLAEKHGGFLSAPDRERFLGGNALEVYGGNMVESGQ